MITELRFLSSATTDQAAISLFSDQISTTALSPSVSTVSLWSSPGKAGTLVIMAVALSGPTVESAVAIATLTFVGIMTFSLEAKYIGKKAAFYRNFFAFLFSFVVAFFMGVILG